MADTNTASGGKKPGEVNKMLDVVFVVDHDRAKMVPVKIGISDENYWEITDGLKEGDEIVSGSYHAISHDLDDGKKVMRDSTSATATKTQL
jgi:HlyD family secretion protein